MILAVDESGATQKMIDIPRMEKHIPDLKIRKVALEKPLDVNKYYQETRNAEVLKTGEQNIIEDITSVEYQSIDSIQKVGKVLQELLRMKHQETQPFTTTSWLYGWNNMELEVKNKKYSMFMCNEFNFFLYFKDKEYFEEVVKPSIAGKIEKTLIDYFLLEEYEKVEEYKFVSIFDNLNALEQCLLISVVNRSDPETAKNLAEQFLNRAKLVETNIAKKNQKFDTVLLMKILESDEVDDDEDDEEEEKKDKKKKKKGKGNKKKKPKRQASMSLSSNSSMEEMNWNIKQRYDDDSDDASLGGEYEGEGNDYEGEDSYRSRYSSDSRSDRFYDDEDEECDSSDEIYPQVQEQMNV